MKRINSNFFCSILYWYSVDRWMVSFINFFLSLSLSLCWRCIEIVSSRRGKTYKKLAHHIHSIYNYCNKQFALMSFSVDSFSAALRDVLCSIILPADRDGPPRLVLAVRQLHRKRVRGSPLFSVLLIAMKRERVGNVVRELSADIYITFITSLAI